MTVSRHPTNVAVLDDYQGVAMRIVDWSRVSDRANIAVFKDHLADQNAVAERLAPFDVVCIMRERTPMPGSLLRRLPNLKLIASTGPRNASIDLAAAAERGISVAHTGYTSAPTIELTWALILASARHISSEAASVRNGGWQHTLGDDLAGKTLGILGLGNVGSGVAKVGLAFGMNVIAWSQNLTSDIATAAGARLVSKEELLRTADVISIHLVLSARTVGLIGAAEFALMKPSARTYKHLAWPPRGRGSSLGCARQSSDIWSCDRRLRYRALAARSPLSTRRKPACHSSHRVCHARSLRGFLSRQRREHQRVA